MGAAIRVAVDGEVPVFLDKAIDVNVKNSVDVVQTTEYLSKIASLVTDSAANTKQIANTAQSTSTIATSTTDSSRTATSILNAIPNVTTKLDAIDKTLQGTINTSVDTIQGYNRNGELTRLPLATMHNGNLYGESFTMTSAIIQPVAPNAIESTWFLPGVDTVTTLMPTAVNNSATNNLCTYSNI